MTRSKQHPSPHLSRRGLIKASLLGAATAPGVNWLASAHADTLFPLEPQALQALAIKVTDALPAQVCQRACLSVSAHVQAAGLTGPSGMESLLQLLHRDDLAHGRVHELHGIGLSNTQIGVLAAMRQKVSA
ncbi:MAG: hypothetical protein HY836_12430 [Aquabacterium sp.]|uniref:hypothetical protein n=1 Tax=Aquabacterium sp. TaxID=1872578 RepID=UPI0025C329B4|nr:hypothetical protein [Aquabacterium sp.]MBI5926388.1 hypothetical protein [Aquabacterium sp.]